jgi:hypothetical protein
MSACGLPASERWLGSCVTRIAGPNGDAQPSTARPTAAARAVESSAHKNPLNLGPPPEPNRLGKEKKSPCARPHNSDFAAVHQRWLNVPSETFHGTLQKRFTHFGLSEVRGRGAGADQSLPLVHDVFFASIFPSETQLVVFRRFLVS